MCYAGTVQKWYKNIIIVLKEENVVGRTDIYTTNRKETMKSTIMEVVIGADEIMKFQGVGRVINMDVKVVEDDSREVKYQEWEYERESYRVGNEKVEYFC